GERAKRYPEGPASLEGGDHGERLTPETSEPGQAEGGDRCVAEQAGERRRDLSQTAELGQLTGVRPVLDRPGEEEEQARDDAVGDVADQRGLEPGGGERRDAEQHEAHVPNGGVRDEALELVLRQAHEATDNDR